VPDNLRQSRTLIICPAALVQNWIQELALWLPDRVKPLIGPVYTFLDSTSPQARLSIISAWHTRGGVLILSFDMLTRVFSEKNISTKTETLTTEELEQLRNMLRDPNIVIADEAHNLKNERSERSKVAQLFSTKVRLALTGSPLSNNLGDYYSMIQWVCPGFLGDSKEFAARFQEPIEQGFYADSSTYERRKAQRMLEILKEEIDPKVDRAGYEVLEGDLPPKTEFIIKVPLTDIQSRLYAEYAKFLLMNSRVTGVEITVTSLWAIVSNLGLLDNHPSLFFEKLRKGIEKGKAEDQGISPIAKSFQAGNMSSGEGTPVPSDNEFDALLQGDSSVATAEDIIEADSSVSANDDLLRRLEQLCGSDLQNIKATHHSHRLTIFLHIMTYARSCDDKVLVFSHSIDTLLYLQDLLVGRDHTCDIITGKTPPADRVKATEQFNKAEGHRVYLISGRAGSVGLNIYGANRVILFDSTFNPMWEEQAVGRAYRIGQQKPVYVYKFVSGGTYEDIVSNRTIYKQQLAQRTVDKKNLKARTTRMDAKDFLFEPRPVEQQNLTGFRANDPFIMDKILETSSQLIRSIETTETLHVEERVVFDEQVWREIQEEIELRRRKNTMPIEEYKRRLRFFEEREMREEMKAKGMMQSPSSGYAFKSPHPYSSKPLGSSLMKRIDIDDMPQSGLFPQNDPKNFITTNLSADAKNSFHNGLLQTTANLPDAIGRSPLRPIDVDNPVTNPLNQLPQSPLADKKRAPIAPMYRDNQNGQANGAVGQKQVKGVRLEVISLIDDDTPPPSPG
jgi:superfamily II DNA or RNA helicase